MEIYNGNNFNEVINKGITLIDFYADWCGPCRMITPILEELSKELTDVKFVKLDIDKYEEIAQKYGVMTIPTVIIFKDGRVLREKVGFQSKDMAKKWIEETKTDA